MTLRRIASNTVWLTSAEVIIKLIALVFNFILVRLISVTSYGDYNLVNAFVAIFSFLPDLGVNLIALRDLAARPARYPRLIGQVAIINVLFSFVSFAAILFLFPVYAGAGNQHLWSLIIIAALTLIVTSLRTLAKLGFDAHQQMHISAVFTIINAAFSIVGSLVGFKLSGNLIGLFGGNLTAAGLSLILEWGIAFRFFGFPKLSPPSLRLIRQGLPLSLAAAAALISARLDTLIIGRLLTSVAVGWYAAAQTLIFSAIQLFNVPLMAASFPALSQAHKSLKALTLKLTLMILAWSSVFTLLTWILARPIILLLFGTSYLPAVPVLKLLSLLAPLAAMSALFYKVLIILNRQQLYFWISSLGVVINLGTNLWLIPQLGITGAAIAAVMTHLILFIIYVLSVWKYF